MRARDDDNNSSSREGHLFSSFGFPRERRGRGRRDELREEEAQKEDEGSEREREAARQHKPLCVRTRV